METPRQDAYFFAGDFRAVLDSFTQLVGRPRRKLFLSVRAEVTEIPLGFHWLHLRFIFGCIRRWGGVYDALMMRRARHLLATAPQYCCNHVPAVRLLLATWSQGRAALEDKRRMLADMRELFLYHHDIS